MTNAQPKPGADAQDGSDDLMGNIVAFVAIYAMFYEIFGGVARYILVDIGALYINNIPSVCSALLFAAYFAVAILKNRKIEKFMIGLLAVIAIYVAYAFFCDLVPEQAGFGFYIWALFVLGALLCAYEKEETVFRFMIFFWAITVIGVLINYFIEFPWAGLSYEVAGVPMSVARKWYALGYERLVGFGRFSFSAAGIILLSYGYILASRKFPRLFVFAAYFISGAAIFLTTGKTQFVLLLALPFYVFIYRHLCFLAPRTRIPMIWAVFIIAAMIFFTITLPIALDPDWLRRISGSYLFFSSSSMIERVTAMWPGAWKIFRDHGSNFILGSGIGGIGIPVAINDIKPLNTSADNLFLYVFVSGGLLATIPLFWGLLRNLAFLYKQNPQYFEIICVLSFCVLGPGVTANLIEDPTLAIFLGFLVARGYIRPRRVEA